jgi:hypothetical protein
MTNISTYSSQMMVESMMMVYHKLKEETLI